jgi:hypothetical protein
VSSREQGTRHTPEHLPARDAQFHGLIQHSFALQLAERRRPFRGRTNLERLIERFSLAGGEEEGFSVKQVGELVRDRTSTAFAHSPLGKGEWTTIRSLEMEYLRCDQDKLGSLPRGLDWNANDKDGHSAEYEEPRFIFADTFDDHRETTAADFFVDAPDCQSGAGEISKALLEVMAHKRSRLFGFALANRFVNLMLPHGILTQAGGAAENEGWLLQPLVSFIRGGRDRTRLRRTYTLTLFFLPVEVENTELGPSLAAAPSRCMSTLEITQLTNAGWSFAASPPVDVLLKFRASGPLFHYLSGLARFDLHDMLPLSGQPASDSHDSSAFGCLTVRQAVEKIGFGVGLSVAQGSHGRVGLEAMRRIGNDVIMSLGSARVSSVAVVDDELTAGEVNGLTGRGTFPGKLLALMEALAKPLRMPLASDPDARELRLDRSFDDDDIYATGVIPTRHCVVVASRIGAQYGSRESALMQAGSVAYMALGAATAIGTLREIDKELEHLEGANPSKVAQIDREIAADLNEIYDLDITRESYRRMYRRLRDCLGITRDYETLQDEMNALHRATTTVHGDKAQRMLAVLTAAIVALSVLILIGTLVLIGKPGG